MKERMFKKNQIVEMRISDYASDGSGLSKIPTDEGIFNVFVHNTLPGQRVKAMIEKCDKRYALARLVEIVERSAEETETPWQDIPGAPYIHLPIEQQQHYKKQAAFELYKRIGKLDDPAALFDTFIASPLSHHYRNKMEYSFSMIRYNEKTKSEEDEFGLGFKHRGTWWCVENLNKDSGMFDAAWENSMPQIRQWLENTGLPAWHPPQRKGFFRYLVVRKSFKHNKLLINLVTSSESLSRMNIQDFADFILKLHPGRIAGLLHTINDEVADRTDPLNGKSTLLYGQEIFEESVLGLNFEISMKSFFQTNPASAEKLYTKAMEYAAQNMDNQHHVMLDLFCGTGTIAQLLARQFQCKVVGVDIVAEAIENAKENALRNDLKDVTFIAADVGKFLQENPEYTGRIKTLVIDPPRAGIAPKTLNKIIALGAENMVYISCNPATQARDTEILYAAGYRMIKFSLVDQFPHTAHIESVALFRKNLEA